MRISLLLPILACLAALALRAHEWPHHAGPAFDFSTPHALGTPDWSNSPPALLWRTALSDNGYACPSLADNTVFIIDHEGSNDIVRAFALATGAERWRFAYPDTALSAHGYARAAPTWDEGRLYTLSRLGHLHCLDANTGALLWQTHFIADFAGLRPEHSFCMPPRVWGDRLFVGPGGTNGCIAALDKRTGSLLWRGGPEDPPGHAIPVITPLAGRETLLCFSAKALLGFDPATGARLWEHPRPTQFGNNIAQPLLLGNDRVLVSSGDGLGTALLSLAGGTPAPLWESKSYHTLFATPVAIGNLLFVSSNTRQQGLTCADLATGAVHWVNPRFDKFTSLLRAGSRLLALESAKGDLVLIEPDPSGCREVTRFRPLGKRSWTPPILTPTHLIIRNTEELACFTLAPPPGP